MSSTARGMAGSSGQNKGIYVAIAIVMLALDQISKYWVVVTRRDYDDLEVIRGLLNISYTENQGIAFGMFNSGEFKWLLIGVSIVAICAVVYYLKRAPASNRLLLWSLGLLAAGITGNLIDRIRLGRVIDFIQVYVVFQGRRHEWPVFNVADTAITIGAALMAIELLVSPSTKKSSDEESAAGVMKDSPLAHSEPVPLADESSLE